jgi:hypothetical protein
MVQASLTNRRPAMGCNPTYNPIENREIGPFSHGSEIYGI